jgi:hypothetical protein
MIALEKEVERLRIDNMRLAAKLQEVKNLA